MKTLTSCALVLALALIAAPAVHAASAAAPAAQPAVVTAPAAQAAIDAPVVAMMAPSQQPVFANLQASVGTAATCLDSGTHCGGPSDCTCRPTVNCACLWNGVDFTCQICP